MTKASVPGSAEEAMDEMVAQAGGVKAVAAFEGITASAVYKLLDADQDGEFSWSRVRRIVAHFKADAPVRDLAALAGCVVYRLPAGSAGATLIANAIGRTAKETGDVMMRVGEALRDGRIDQGERAAIKQEILEAIVSLASLSEDIDRAALEGDRS